MPGELAEFHRCKISYARKGAAKKVAMKLCGIEMSVRKERSENDPRGDGGCLMWGIGWFRQAQMGLSVLVTTLVGQSKPAKAVTTNQSLAWVLVVTALAG